MDNYETEWPCVSHVCDLSGPHSPHLRSVTELMDGDC